MNFYGHAVLAAEDRQHPEFVLGAMLPDLAGMAGLRLPDLQSAELRAGVAHHHRVDAAFHTAPQFVELVSAALSDLCARGVARGPSRAVAHVGVELLLDGWLSSSTSLRSVPYHEALRTVADCIELQQVGHRATLVRLSERLQQAPIPQAYGDPQFVADRLAYMLQDRKRLRLQPNDLPSAVAILKNIQNSLETNAASLLAHVRKGLLRTPTSESRDNSAAEHR